MHRCGRRRSSLTFPRRAQPLNKEPGMVGTKFYSGITPVAAGLLLAYSGVALSAGAGAPKGVTFSKDVAPIFQAKCQ